MAARGESGRRGRTINEGRGAMGGNFLAQVCRSRGAHGSGDYTWDVVGRFESLEEARGALQAYFDRCSA